MCQTHRVVTLLAQALQNLHANVMYDDLVLRLFETELFIFCMVFKWDGDESKRCMNRDINRSTQTDRYTEQNDEILHAPL
jgi:hypothetical protein